MKSKRIFRKVTGLPTWIEDAQGRVKVEEKRTNLGAKWKLRIREMWETNLTLMFPLECGHFVRSDLKNNRKDGLQRCRACEDKYYRRAA